MLHVLEPIAPAPQPLPIPPIPLPSETIGDPPPSAPVKNRAAPDIATNDILTHLPQDFHALEPGGEREAWERLKHAEGETLVEKVDLIGTVATEERRQGASGWQERAFIKLGQQESSEFSRQHLTQLNGIFQTFRVQPPFGLGYSSDQLSKYGVARLRQFSGSREWAVKNPEKVVELLETAVSSEQILRDIKALQNPDSAAPVAADPDSFVNFTVRVTRQWKQTFDDILAAALLRISEFEPQLKPTPANALSLIMTQWADYGSFFIEVPNERGYEKERLNPLTGELETVFVEEAEVVGTGGKIGVDEVPAERTEAQEIFNIDLLERIKAGHRERETAV